MSFAKPKIAWELSIVDQRTYQKMPQTMRLPQAHWYVFKGVIEPITSPPENQVSLYHLS